MRLYRNVYHVLRDLQQLHSSLRKESQEFLECSAVKIKTGNYKTILHQLALKSLNSLFLNITKVSFPHKVWSNNNLWSPAGLVGTNHYVNTLKHKIYGHAAPKEDFLEPLFFGTVVKFSTFASSPARDDKFIGFLMTYRALFLILVFCFVLYSYQGIWILKLCF